MITFGNHADNKNENNDDTDDHNNDGNVIIRTKTKGQQAIIMTI